jgi:hypothetical protein
VAVKKINEKSVKRRRKVLYLVHKLVRKKSFRTKLVRTKSVRTKSVRTKSVRTKLVRRLD